MNSTENISLQSQNHIQAYTRPTYHGLALKTK